jgi:hypothetical protein
MEQFLAVEAAPHANSPTNSSEDPKIEATG